MFRKLFAKKDVRDEQRAALAGEAAFAAACGLFTAAHAEILGLRARLKADEAARAAAAVAAAAQELAASRCTASPKFAERASSWLVEARESAADASDLADLAAGMAEAARAEDGKSLVGTLAARLADHALFLRDAAARAGKGGAVRAHTECAFGKWYHGAGREALGGLPEFCELDAPHREVHEAAAGLVVAGDLESAERLVRASLQLLRGFLALKEAALQARPARQGRA